jgi:hypothetical protein
MGTYETYRWVSWVPTKSVGGLMGTHGWVIPGPTAEGGAGASLADTGRLPRAKTAAKVAAKRRTRLAGSLVRGLLGICLASCPISCAVFAGTPSDQIVCPSSDRPLTRAPSSRLPIPCRSPQAPTRHPIRRFEKPVLSTPVASP